MTDVEHSFGSKEPKTSEATPTSRYDMVAGILPDGELPYIEAQSSLVRMLAANHEDGVYLAQIAVREAAESDTEGLFVPPLPRTYSKVLQDLNDTRETWTKHVYDGPFSPNRVVVDSDSVSAAELLVGAIVRYGSGFNEDTHNLIHLAAMDNPRSPSHIPGVPNV